MSFLSPATVRSNTSFRITTATTINSLSHQWARAADEIASARSNAARRTHVFPVFPQRESVPAAAATVTRPGFFANVRHAARTLVVSPRVNRMSEAIGPPIHDHDDDPYSPRSGVTRMNIARDDPVLLTPLKRFRASRRYGLARSGRGDPSNGGESESERSGNTLFMPEKSEPTLRVDWRESWRPAFDRLLTSIAIAAKLTAPR
jgi:hypothetical protein